MLVLMRFAPPWVVVSLLALIRACCRRLAMVARLVVLRGVSGAVSAVAARIVADNPLTVWRVARMCRRLALVVSRLWVKFRPLPRPAVGFRVRVRLLLVVALLFPCCRA